jgi:hypothetical protein
MNRTGLPSFAAAVASGEIEIVDLTHTLTPEFPTIALPPEFIPARISMRPSTG